MNRKQLAWIAFVVFNLIGTFYYQDLLINMWMLIVGIGGFLLLAFFGLLTILTGYDALGDSERARKKVRGPTK